jgi:hypothetical protein
MSIPMIAGLYPYTRADVTQPPVVTLREIPASLEVNPLYRDRLIVLAGDEPSASHLRHFGLEVRRVFADAPASIRRDAAHKMKHWMCRWALAEFGEFLWVDWDTICIRPPDEQFAEWTRRTGNAAVHPHSQLLGHRELRGLLRVGGLGCGHGRQLRGRGVGAERRAVVGLSVASRRCPPAGILVG